MLDLRVTESRGGSGDNGESNDSLGCVHDENSDRFKGKCEGRKVCKGKKCRKVDKVKELKTRQARKSM